MTDEDAYEAKPQLLFDKIRFSLQRIIKEFLSKPMPNFSAVGYLESMIEIRQELALKANELTVDQLQKIQFQLELMDQICRDRLNQERYIRMQDSDPK